MDDRVLPAADNNARWCDLMCRLHGIPTATESGYWVARRRSPDLYPDAVTLLPHAAAEDVLRMADSGPGCSVKDSFGTLDLAPWGFDGAPARPVGSGSRCARTGRAPCGGDRQPHAVLRRRDKRLHDRHGRR